MVCPLGFMKTERTLIFKGRVRTLPYDIFAIMRKTIKTKLLTAKPCKTAYAVKWRKAKLCFSGYSFVGSAHPRQGSAFAIRQKLSFWTSRKR